MPQDLKRLFGLSPIYNYWNAKPLVTEIYISQLPIRINTDTFKATFASIVMREQPRLRNMMIHSQKTKDEDSFGLEIAISSAEEYEVIVNIAERAINAQITKSGLFPNYQVLATCAHVYKKSIPRGNGPWDSGLGVT